MVEQMNYLKIYKKLCLNGQQVRELNYTEHHHIVPRCMDGDDSLLNLTTLTAREHYLAHYLLTKIYINNGKILHAFGMMSRSNGFQHRNFKSSQYEKMKMSHSDAMKVNNPMLNDNARAKARKTKMDRIKRGEIIPRTLSEQERYNISERMIGSNNPSRKYPEKHNFKNNKYVLGKICYNNGVVNKYFHPEDFIPIEFIKGNKPYTRTTNGKQSNHG